MPEMMNITVRNKIATKTDNVAYVCGNSDYVINFDFDSEWDAYDTKTARFAHDGQHTDVVFSGNQCNAPIITNTYAFHVGVFAGDLHTTTAARVPCRKSILCGSGAPADPTPDVYDQLMARINDLGDVGSVVQRGYNDVVAAISNMFGETETVLCTVTPEDFDENRMCLIPSEETFTFSTNSYVKAQIETESTSSEIRLDSENIAAGKYAFFCNEFGLVVGAKPNPESHSFLDYAGFCVNYNPDFDMSKMTRLTFVKVDVKKIPIEYVDTTDIEGAIRNITDEVSSL